MGNAVIMDPSKFTEGTILPVNKNMLVTEAKVILFTYPDSTNTDGTVKPGVTTTALQLKLKEDDGTEHEQIWSISDPSKFKPTADGDGFEAVGSAQFPGKNSNFSILLNEYINAGLPQTKLSASVKDMFTGLYALWIGKAPPTRDLAGSTRKINPATGQPYPPNLILVVSKILTAPWDQKKAVGGKPAAVKADTAAVTAKAVAFISGVVDENGGKATRSDVSKAALKKGSSVAADPDKNAIVSAIFAPATAEGLAEAGITLNGEVFSKEE